MGLARRTFNIGFVSLTRTITKFPIASLTSAYNSESNRSLSLGTLAFEEVQVSTNGANNETKKPYKSTAFILHGLRGSVRDWRSFSRDLASFLSSNSPGWKLVLVDLRNHGKSAEVEGHSLGGKVAMQFAKSCAQGDYGTSATLPKQLWVLDCIPGILRSTKKDEDYNEERILQKLRLLPNLKVPSREWLVEHLRDLAFSKRLSQWLAANLKISGDQMTLEFNLKGVTEMFYSYRENEYWSLLESPPKEMDISIVKAEIGSRWKPIVLEKLRSLSSKERHASEGTVSLHVLPNAEHFVQVDNPKDLEIIGPRMASLG